jgi:hypothetical protein
MLVLLIDYSSSMCLSDVRKRALIHTFPHKLLRGYIPLYNFDEIYNVFVCTPKYELTKEGQNKRKAMLGH